MGQLILDVKVRAKGHGSVANVTIQGVLLLNILLYLHSRARHPLFHVFQHIWCYWCPFLHMMNPDHERSDRFLRNHFYDPWLGVGRIYLSLIGLRWQRQQSVSKMHCENIFIEYACLCATV